MDARKEECFVDRISVVKVLQDSNPGHGNLSENSFNCEGLFLAGKAPRVFWVLLGRVMSRNWNGRPASFVFKRQALN